VTASKVEVVVEAPAEPPSKRPRRSLEGGQLTEMNGTESKGRQTRSAKNQEVPIALDTTTGRPKKANQAKPSKLEPEVLAAQEEIENEDSDEDIAGGPEEMDEDEVASVAGDADGYESPTETTELQNFPLSKARLNKNSIVYADDSVLCIRIKEKTVGLSASTSIEQR
jgi:polynucleotide 5'-hydroxyl-kinase GRC3/NOL9